MIHYMTTQGVGDAWVGNELRVLAQSGIPFRLSALNRPANTYFTSSDVAELDAATYYVYPLSTLSILGAIIAAPLRFGGRFFGALWNGLTGERESLRIRLLRLWHSRSRMGYTHVAARRPHHDIFPWCRLAAQKMILRRQSHDRSRLDRSDGH